MTEDEAKTKWCPFARVLTADARDHYPAANRAAMVEGGQFTMNTNPVHSRCIGSDCMAWRWSEPPVRKWRVTKADGSTEEDWGWDPMTHPEKDRCGVVASEETTANRKGYCGLVRAS